MAAMLCDSIIVVLVCTSPWAMLLAVITMRKLIHGFPFLSYLSMRLCLGSAMVLLFSYSSWKLQWFVNWLHVKARIPEQCRGLKWLPLTLSWNIWLNLFDVHNLLLASTFCFPQLVGNLFIFICANMTGVFTKYPTEISQRRAFLETRRCIESRLTIMKENQNQVLYIMF